MIVMAATLLAAGAAQAGPYTDDLSKCLVGKSTMDDHLVLVQWIYAALSRNPAVASMGTVSDSQVDQANQRMAELFMRLLTVTCKDQAKLALKYEGDFAMQQSFEQLGNVAGRDMFASPDVQKGMSGLAKYIDPTMMMELKSP
ncbi:hypothetical protein EZM97_32375 [Dyella soli]|uniref:DUF2059 domain-containing protein n=1 Tax=Dyella soli TaxID=522319 RepID=A0A4R0YGE1_9GAMM|nr:hypothetical protein [Dyella soli]TCI07294.1 hypothetical protein EZM97_32375 [Dyella soli]